MQVPTKAKEYWIANGDGIFVDAEQNYIIEFSEVALVTKFTREIFAICETGHTPFGCYRR